MSRYRLPNISIFVFGLLCAQVLTSGCAVHNKKKPWNSVSFLAPLPHITNQSAASSNSTSAAKTSYANGCELQASGSPECVDWFALAAQQSWSSNLQRVQGLTDSTRENQLYDSAVGRLITSAQQFGKFDPASGVRLSKGATIPIFYNGVQWQPAEISRLELVGEYEAPEGLRVYSQSGLGVPLLVHAQPQRKFTHSETAFVATAIVRPSDVSSENGSSEFVLEIVNTLKTRAIPVNGQLTSLAFDTTAPLGYLNTFAERLGISGLLKPNLAKEQYGLRMMTPYQPGKIPVIFVHGLASDPLTWGSMANDVFFNQDIIDRFQFWTFSYPTGKPFPLEAANLRRQLVELHNHIDPNRTDPALDDIVLIGHSMGGLVSKMQITSSQDQLIRSMSKVPLDQLQLQPQTRAQLAGFFEFSPSTQISRVIFIGTPHQGSNLAKGIGSRLASRLIRQPDEIAEVFDEIRTNNKQLLNGKMRRMPTSVDLLRPDNALTQAIFKLPVDPRISMHSIIGVGHSERFGLEPSDGIVPYSSAQHPNTESELTVDAGHSLHSHPESTAEVVRILRLHANQPRVQHRFSTTSKPDANKY